VKSFKTLILNNVLLIYYIIGFTNKDLVEILAGPVAGIHSMTEEHFGISVIEFMASDRTKTKANANPSKTNNIFGQYMMLLI